MNDDEIMAEIHRLTDLIQREYDQRFWHTVAHGFNCCCVLPAISFRPVCDGREAQQ